MDEPPPFSVVVATKNRCDRVLRLLDRLRAQQAVRPPQIVVVDDGSTDATTARLTELRERWPDLVLLRSDRSKGPASARNMGWRAATGRYIAFTDDDCQPTTHWLASLLSAHEAGADVVQGPTVPPDDAFASRTALSHWIRVQSPSFRFETCNISYTRGLLEQLGGFDEGFGTSRGGAPYGEDADLGWRATEAGATFAFAEGAVVVHDVVTDGLWPFLVRRLRRGSMPYFVRKHPGYRRHLPHPWLMSQAHPPAVLAAVGLLAAVGTAFYWGPALLILAPVSALPYVHFRIYRQRVAGRRRLWPVAVAAAWAADLVEIGALVGGSLRERTLLL
jgi:glycosyltransferase involved in cell wall biosynthesis